MCFQILELYSLCRCMYYQHAVDRCAAYGRPGHGIQRRSILVGKTCSEHARSSQGPGASQGHGYSMTRDEPKRLDGHRLSTVRDSVLRSKDNTASNSRRAATTGSQQNDPIHRDLGTRDLGSRQPGPDSVFPPTAVSGKDKLAADTDGLNESDESPDWDEESVESLDWEEESVRSVASSATTIDGDTVGVLFNRLLNFGDLRFLWPQLISQSRSWKRSQRTVERLLLRYCQDLDKLSANPISNQSITESQRIMRKRASKFIRRSRSNLAQRICEAHYRVEAEEPPSAEDEVTTWLEKNPDATSDSDSEDDEPMLFLEAAEIFLFRTDPIVYLQGNLKALVKLRIPQTKTSLITRGWNYTRFHFENMVNSVERNGKPIAPGRTRLNWTCSCGKALHDDFVELRPGALADLNHLLQSYGKDAHLNHGISTQEIIQTLNDENLPAQTTPRQQAGWKQRISSAANSGIGLVTSLVASSASLPRYQQDMNSDIATTGACIQTGSGGAGVHDFLLLCVPFMRVATKLYQPEICRINSDQEFLKLLRHYYQTKRGRSPWSLLRKVKLINFIKFEMYRNNLADIRHCPSIPPPEKRGTEYGYDPDGQSQQDLGVMPPIGPNHLAHLFEHPEHADVLPAIWRRIPRKLKSELKACPTRGSSLGWGLHLVEGMEWFLFSVLGCAGFFLCLLVSIIWSVVKEDVQGGFSIGGFLLAFFIFGGSMIHLMVLE